MPGTGGFLAEVLVISASCHLCYELALLLGLSIVLSGSYALWLYSRLAHGNVSSVVFSYVVDVSRTETSVLSILGLLILALGLKPMLLVQGLHPVAVLLVASSHVLEWLCSKLAVCFVTSQIPGHLSSHKSRCP